MTKQDRWEFASRAHREIVRDLIGWPERKILLSLSQNPKAVLAERAAWLKTPAGREMLALAKRHAELLEKP